MVNLDDLKKQETRLGRMRAGHKTQASIVLLQDGSDVQIQLPTSTRTRISNNMASVSPKLIINDSSSSKGHDN